MLYYKFIVAMVILISACSAGLAQDSTKFIWDKLAFEVLFIKDSTLINEVSKELLIPLKTKPDRIALVDLNHNGPGLNDIVVVYPSHQIFPLEFLTDNVAKIIRKWPRPDHQMMVAPNDSNIISRIRELDPQKVPLAPFWASIGETVHRFWSDQPLKVFYTQTPEDFKIEVLRMNANPEPFWMLRDSTETDSTQKKHDPQ